MSGCSCAGGDSCGGFGPCDYDRDARDELEQLAAIRIAPELEQVRCSCRKHAWNPSCLLHGKDDR